LIGHGLGGFLVTWLNASGAVLTLITLLFVAFLVMTRIPVNVLVEGIGKTFKALAKAFKLAAVATKNMVLKGLSSARSIIKKLQIVRQEMQEINKANVEPVIVTRSRNESFAKAAEKPNKVREEKAEFVVQDNFSFMSSSDKYQVPPLSLLEDHLREGTWKTIKPGMKFLPVAQFWKKNYWILALKDEWFRSCPVQSLLCLNMNRHQESKSAE